jgi:hypothetical protein
LELCLLTFNETEVLLRVEFWGKARVAAELWEARRLGELALQCWEWQRE